VNRKKRKESSARWARFAKEIVGKAGVIDESTYTVLVKAFAAVPRVQFIEEAFNLRAHEDVALPIGFGQTISKPSTVARMLAIIGIGPGTKVLEIGCGSGYCSAVMSSAMASVYAVEYVGLLAQKTRRKLDKLGFHNILVRSGDGSRGWKEHAPYDAIVVSAAFDLVTPELLSQLKDDGGKLVAPLKRDDAQVLTLYEKTAGKLSVFELEPCHFVEAA